MSNTDKKVVLITGASDGLGLAAALKYAQAKHIVVLAGRSQEKLEKAVNLVQKAVPGKQPGFIHTLCFDFASFQSVRKGAADFLALELPLHILINNAGVVATKHEFTEESKAFEKTIMINMVGPLLFTELLLPKMKVTGGRILIVSSSLHNPAEKSVMEKQQDPSRLILPLDNLDGSKSWTSAGFYAVNTPCHCQASKLADVWWAYVLADKLSTSDPKITVNAFCPGFVPSTGLAREYPWVLRKTAQYVLPLIISTTLTSEQSGERYLEYGTDERFKDVSGCFYRHGEIIDSSVESHDMDKAKTVYNKACQVADIEESKVEI
ncbi:hypothetical protein INT43_006331 [Umbelopsis isabellina]|uniref:Uncharacterized protein n=1 Tax=Mortierella isabellina TaxID=91625 RepID=A0A8H7Q031_MORIS|nr:hypothetical protein INT43_006331 [Umbelopsis isabellina]